MRYKLDAFQGNLLDFHIARGGGKIAGPQGLGIYIGDDVFKCPKAWIFVDVNDPPPNTQEILDHLKAGRTTWPEKMVN